MKKKISKEKIAKFIEKNFENFIEEFTSFSMEDVVVDIENNDFSFDTKDIISNNITNEEWYCKICKIKIQFEENVITHIIRDHLMKGSDEQ